MDAGQMQLLLPEVPKWRVTDDGKKIRREWKVKDFATALDFFNRIGQVADVFGVAAGVAGVAHGLWFVSRASAKVNPFLPDYQKWRIFATVRHASHR